MSEEKQSISIEAATLHFLGKASIHASEADLFVAVRNFYNDRVRDQAAATSETGEADSGSAGSDNSVSE